MLNRPQKGTYDNLAYLINTLHYRPIIYSQIIYDLLGLAENILCVILDKLEIYSHKYHHCISQFIYNQMVLSIWSANCLICIHSWC